MPWGGQACAVNHQYMCPGVSTLVNSFMPHTCWSMQLQCAVSAPSGAALQHSMPRRLICTSTCCNHYICTVHVCSVWCRCGIVPGLHFLDLHVHKSLRFPWCVTNGC